MTQLDSFKHFSSVCVHISVEMEFFTVALATIFFLLLNWLWRAGHKNFDIFEKQGVKFIKPTFFVGNLWPFIAKKVTLRDYVVEVFNKFPSAKVTGLFNRSTPIYMIKDTELIKQLGVKDFDHFIGEF